MPHSGNASFFSTHHLGISVHLYLKFLLWVMISCIYIKFLKTHNTAAGLENRESRPLVTGKRGARAACYIHRFRPKTGSAPAPNSGPAGFLLGPAWSYWPSGRRSNRSKRWLPAGWQTNTDCQPPSAAENAGRAHQIFCGAGQGSGPTVGEMFA